MQSQNEQWEENTAQVCLRYVTQVSKLLPGELNPLTSQLIKARDSLILDHSGCIDFY